ncbi:TetR/AcrR family transcriptional regulator [Agromyces sp. GXS1127]|uniref:TetR/AcrR family transcriptional regulator n=1 Tax=Agromyces sp. GXS1127 TaxID=3424181 RepID=UPI003D315A2F
MTEPTTGERTHVRGSLNRDRVLHGAIEFADREGIEPLTIRRLAEHLGVKPMTIYHYVANKEAIIDGMIDLVFDEIDRPSSDDPWREGIRRRSASLRIVLRRHPWATPLMESRTSPGAGTLGHHDAVLACWYRSGLPPELIAHGLAVVDAFVYGFALQEAALPFGEQHGDLTGAAEEIIVPLPSGEHPNLVRFTQEYVLKPGYDFGRSFDFGLDLILDGIEMTARRAGDASTAGASPG